MASESSPKPAEAFQLVPEHDIRNVHGAPGWFELSTPDPEVAAMFLAEAFGWQVARTELAGRDYWIGTVRRHQVAGIRATGLSEPPDPTWVTYVTVSDADAAADAARAAGGTVVVRPTAMGETGRMTIIDHPGTGRMFAVEYRRPFA